MPGIEIHVGFDLKPEHTKSEDVLEQMKEFESKVRRRELERFIDSQCKDSFAPGSESRAARLTLLKRRVRNLLNDLSRYMDRRRVPLFGRRAPKRRSEGDGKR